MAFPGGNEEAATWVRTGRVLVRGGGDTAAPGTRGQGGCTGSAWRAGEGSAALYRGVVCQVPFLLAALPPPP